MLRAWQLSTIGARLSCAKAADGGCSPAILRGRPGKPNQRKGQNEKFMNFELFFVNSGVFPQENKQDSY